MTTSPFMQHAVLALLTIVTQQQQQLAQLQARVADLETRLNQHSQNSSKPPSSDPPSAPPRLTRPPRGRKPGGQPGHPRARVFQGAHWGYHRWHQLEKAMLAFQDLHCEEYLA